LRLVALVLLTALALAVLSTAASTTFAPRQYQASGGVLLPGGMVRVHFEAADPRAAVALVQGFIAQHKTPLMIDPPLVVPVAAAFPGDLALVLLALLVAGLFLLWPRKRAAARSENQLIEVLGEQMLAARPLAANDLARQLLEHWFDRGRALLSVVSPDEGDGGARVAAELARTFAAQGVSTLLIDADLRAPVLHRAFGLRNRGGLADFLENREVRLAQCADHLSLLVAGRSGADPLELLSRRRMRELLAAAASRYRVVLVSTPAAARGPDLQLPAAFGGGVLVVSKHPADVQGLEKLKQLLTASHAQVVGTVLNPAGASD
jgi:Mrp family chromosome partitioning ATPase